MDARRQIYILVTAYGFELSLFWNLAIAVGYFFHANNADLCVIKIMQCTNVKCTNEAQIGNCSRLIWGKWGKTSSISVECKPPACREYGLHKI